MENLNGALAFKGTLDIDDFNVSAQAMERRIQQVSATAEAESAQMETAFGRVATAFAGILGIGAAKSFVSQMIQVRSEMQNTEASFKVFLGTANKANQFFSDLQRYSYNNVFEFADLSKQAAQLLAFRNNAEDVIPIIDKLSNIAAGANAPLGEFVSLWNKAKANNKLLSQDIQMWESRGVPIVYELAQAYGKSEQQIRQMVSAGKIGFKELETAINSLTDRGGMFAGMMQEKMKTLGDSLGLLQDNITNMFNELGAQNQGVLKAGIDLANRAVENYDKLGRMLAALVIGYGTYKAAVIATSLAQKSGTGIAVLDNTVRASKLKILKTEALLSGQSAAATQKMTAAAQAHLAALNAELTAEERANILKQLRIAAIQGVLNAQQQEYLSNLGLTATSEGYEAAAMEVLNVEQRLALSKMDLSEKSVAYKLAAEGVVAAKKQEIDVVEDELKAVYARAEARTEEALAAAQAVEAARYEVYWAKQSGDATRIATAEKKLETAQDNASLAQKNALAAQTELVAKKKEMEAAASKKNVTANTAEAATEVADATAKNVNTVATGRLTIAIKALWTALKQNPLGWIITIVGAVISLFTMFRKKTEDNTDAATEFQNTVRDETTALKMYFEVLRSTENGTVAHKDALQKINTVCKQYNETLLTENATLEEQTKKYEALTLAIQKSARAKIQSSNTELIRREATETEEDALKQLKKDAGKAKTTEITTDLQGNAYVTKRSSDSIRNANAAVWEEVEQLALQESEKLKKLTGDAYDDAFKQSMRKISVAVQAATEASDLEMEAFSGKLSKYLTRVVDAEREASEQTDAMTEALDRMHATFDDEPEGLDFDTANMSMEELKEKAKDIQAWIDAINSKEVKVQTDDYLLDKLLAKLQTVNNAISNQEAALNTEAGINERIKALKDERSQVEIGSAKYRELSSEITKLQNKLPKTYSNIADKRKAFNDRVLAAQRELEEAQLELIEDGVEKQEKALELQHQRNLERIRKEREELIKSKKAAGKGSTLTAEEEQIFTDREAVENKAYERQQMKLVDSEIDYKKQQYELYWKWVEHVGKEAADKQFAQLLEGGASFTDYVNRELAKLTTNPDGSARDRSTLSEGENGRLVAFSAQSQQITQSKTAMDLYTESLSHALEQAGSLAEKIEIIAEYQDKLQNGEFHLNDDERAGAMAGLQQQSDNYQQEVTDTLLSEFQTYEEQKLEIQKQYELLRNAAIAEGNAERLNLVNKGEQEALSALNAQMLMQTESWQNLFADLDSLTVEQIDNLVREIQEKMSTADLNLNPADMKAVLDRLDEAKQKILNINPFKALGKSFNDVFNSVKKGSKDSGATVKKNWKNLANAVDGCFDFVNDAIDSCDVLGDMIGENGKATISMIQGMATAGIAMAAAISTAEKGSVILTAISIALQAIQFIATLFDNDKNLQEKIEAHQKNIEKLERSLDRLKEAYDKTYWTYSEEEREASDARVKDIEAQIAALQMEAQVAISTFNFAKWAKATAEIEKLTKVLQQAKQSGDMFQLLEYQKENLRRQQEELREQIKLENEKKKTDSDQITEWQNKIEDIDNQIAELEADMLETLAGTDTKSAIDEFGDAIWDACISGGDAVQALGDKIKDVMRNAVKESLKRQFLAKGINDAVEYLGHAMEDERLTDEERAKFEALANAAGERYRQAIEALGDWVKDAEDLQEDAMTGAARQLTEDTGSIIAGRFNASIINQSIQIQLSRDQLAYHAQIAANTGKSAEKLESIDNRLARLENSGTSLLSQGLS